MIIWYKKRSVHRESADFDVFAKKSLVFWHHLVDAKEDFLGNDSCEGITESGLVSLGFDGVGYLLPFDQAEVGGLLKSLGEAGAGIPVEDDVDVITSISLSNSMLQSVEYCCGDLYPNVSLFLTDVKANETFRFGIKRIGNEIGFSAGAVAIVH